MKRIVQISALLVAAGTSPLVLADKDISHSQGPIVFSTNRFCDSGPNYETRMEIQADGWIILKMHVWHHTALRGYTTNQRIFLRDKDNNVRFYTDAFTFGLGPELVPFSAPEERKEVKYFKLAQGVDPSSIASMDVEYWNGGSKDTPIPDPVGTAARLLEATHPPNNIVALGNVNVK